MRSRSPSRFRCPLAAYLGNRDFRSGGGQGGIGDPFLAPEKERMGGKNEGKGVVVQEAPPMDLPDDLWVTVFRLLGRERYWADVSLVCRRFLSITNVLRSQLTITDRTLRRACSAHGGRAGLIRLFRRFPNVQRITVSDFGGDLDLLLRDIANSNLKVEALDLSRLFMRFPTSAAAELGERKGDRLKTLILSDFYLLHKKDVIAIAEMFPNLEELDISQPMGDINYTSYLHEMVDDEAIESLSSKLRNLRSIRLTGNQFLTDHTLVFLALNCRMLTEIVAHDCTFILGSGIAFALRECQNLTSFSINKIGKPFPGEENSFLHATALRRLCLSHIHHADDLLIAIGKAGLPLQEFCLSDCPRLSFTGFSAMMQSCGGTLRELLLFRVKSVCDESMVAVLPYLSKLHSIQLNYCGDLSNVTFFGLVNCASIEKIEMIETKLGYGVLPEDVRTNRRIRYLNFEHCHYLGDKVLQHIAEVCPQLQSLNISHCKDLTGKGVGKVGEVCRDLRNLSLVNCRSVEHLGTGSGFLKLESLQVERTALEDESLLWIAENCGQLSWLRLSECHKVTERGVKEVVSQCQKLRRLSVSSRNVDSNFLNWIVFTKPFLRQIEWESGDLPRRVQDLFLRHGCIVSTTR